MRRVVEAEEIRACGSQFLLEDVGWPIDQTVLLCVDQVVVHHCEKDRVEKGMCGGRGKGGRSDHDECK